MLLALEFFILLFQDLHLSPLDMNLPLFANCFVFSVKWNSYYCYRMGNREPQSTHRDRKSGQHHVPGQRLASWGNESLISGGNKQMICILNIKLLFKAHPLFSFLFFWCLPKSSPKVNITRLDIWILSHSVKQTSLFTFSSLDYQHLLCVACSYISRKIKQN